MPQRIKQPGFTLIELLVVMSIIAMLIAILLPALNSAREAGRRVACASAMHQLGVGVGSYTVDYKGELPPVTRVSRPFTTYFMRHLSSKPLNLDHLRQGGYVTTPQAFYCPTQNSRTSASLSLNGPDNDWDGNRLRSSFPARLLRRDDGSAMGTGTLGWHIRDYHQRVLYSDFLGVDGWNGGAIVDGLLLAPHESSGFNRLFGDGSVRWMAPGPLTGSIDDTEPTSEEQAAFYEEMDQTP